MRVGPTTADLTGDILEVCSVNLVISKSLLTQSDVTL